MSASRDSLLAGLADGGIAVRMYRPGGLGDCYLLAFPPAEEPRFLLLDCGVFNGTAGGSRRMRAIARDVADVTGNHLHALVATHEHWDHLSGFKWAKTVFDRLEVDEVWVAWTEDRGDDLANELRGMRRRTARALAAAVQQLGEDEPEQAAAMAEVLGFGLGLDKSGAPDLLGAASPGTAKQMDYVCSQWGTPRFLRPGTDLRWPGLRFYVLGPPVDRELLERSDPSAAASEVYEGAALNGTNAFGVAALAALDPAALDGDEAALAELAQPFARNHRIALSQAREPGEDATPEERGTAEFFRRLYGWGDDEDEGPRWRRIGGAWLSAAGGMALQLDSDTNNTSLALAIEHTASGKVLLFPADAQVGNWLSWHRHTWKRDGDACGGEPATAGEPITARELLGRTVLYKVGHHGSHNATLRELGLELMTHPELVAMIPVDADQAANKHWAMPFAPLFRRLVERCGHRILRADEGIAAQPDNVPAADWQRFTGRCAVDDLWVQYSVPL